MSHKESGLRRTLTVALLVGIALLVAIPSVMALNSMFKTWQKVYPHSGTSDAGCAVCHGNTTQTLNAYGRDLCVAFDGSIPADITADLLAIEGLDSDGDGSSNLVEIEAGAQPGWTAGDNALYATLDGGCAPTGDVISVPSSVPVPYDPPAGGEPVADPNGPYTGNVNVPLTFDGSGSYDSDETDVIVAYDWSFGDGQTGTGMMPEHTYAAPGTYLVTLTVTDDEGQMNTATSSAAISGDSVLDLDIAAFKVDRTARVGKEITIELAVTNDGEVLGQALATVTGAQNGEPVYMWSLNVYDYIGKGDTSFSFPAYTANNAGEISWTVTIYDVDPDSDEAFASTLVK